MSRSCSTNNTNEPRSALLTSPHTGATGIACSQTGTKPHGEHDYPASPAPELSSPNLTACTTYFCLYYTPVYPPHILSRDITVFSSLIVSKITVLMGFS